MSETKPNYVKMLRVVSYNVQSFTDSHHSISIDRIIQTLSELDADVIGLQEVGHCERWRDPYLRRIAKELKMNYVFAPASHFTFGNAVLSKHEILKTGSVRMGDAEKRSAVYTTLNIRLSGSGNPEQTEPITVVCTHLDHISPIERCNQMLKMRSFLRKEGISTMPHVVIGDFNSLTRTDYNDEQWGRIVQERKENGWDMPVVVEIHSFVAAGYRDANLWYDPLKDGKDRSKYFTAHTEDPMYRIDYCWISEAMADLNMTIDLSIVDRDATGSDHLPLLTVISCTKT